MNELPKSNSSDSASLVDDTPLAFYFDTDITKIFADFRVPGFDVATWESVQAPAGNSKHIV